MKKSNRILLVALLLALACTLSVLAYALPLANYQNSLITEKFSANRPQYTAGTSFDGYPGNFTVGSFESGKPYTYAPFYGFSKTHNIICRGASGNDGNQWTYGGMYLHSNRDRMILVHNYYTAIGYTVPYSGNIDISFDDFALYNGLGSGKSAVLSAKFAVYKNGELIWPAEGTPAVYDSGTEVADGTRYSPAAPEINGISVKAGDILTFGFTRNNDNSWYAYLSPAVTYNSYGGEVLSQEDAFSAYINGLGGWYSYYGMPGRDAAYPLVGDEENACFGGIPGAGTVYAGGLTVGDTYETVLIFRSPMIATYTLSASEFTANGAVKVRGYVYRSGCAEPSTLTEDLDLDAGNNELLLDGFNTATPPYHPREILFESRTSGSFADVTNIYLDRGDLVVLRFAPVSGGAEVTFTPTMTATDITRDTSKNGNALTALAGGEALCPDVRLTATAISLTGRVNMYFYAHFTDTMADWADEFGVLYFAADETDFTYKNGTALTYAGKSENTYSYLLSDINAKEMSDRFYVRAYAKTGQITIYDEVRSCSVRDTAMQYRDAYAGSASIKNTALYELVCEMLNYGAAAQTYFDYRTDDLANRHLTSEEKVIDTPSYSNKYQKTPSSNSAMEGISFYAVTLLLEDLPRFRMFIDLPADADLSRLTLEMATDADFENIKETYALDECPIWSGNKRRVLTEGITPADLKTVYYFRVTDGSAYSEVLAYSVESYAFRTQNESEELRATLDAMFAYADAAVAYLTASSQPTVGTAISSADLLNLIRENALTAGNTYTVTDTSPIVFTDIDNSKVYDLKGITVISEGGIALLETDGLALKNFTLSIQKAPTTAIVLYSAKNTVLDGIAVTGSSACGVKALVNTDRLFFQNSSVEGAKVGILTASTVEDIYLTSVSVHATSGAALSDAADAYVTDSILISDGATAIILTGENAELRGNTVSAAENAILADGASNLLIAENTLTAGAITVTDSDNVSVLLNTASSVNGEGNAHLYVVQNTLSDLTLKNNNYLIADKNSGNVIASGNQNFNGDDVTDTEARLDAGADEKLLPHVDKDQFVGMERKDSVRTANGEYVPVLTYITDKIAAGDKHIILAPGAYATYDRLFLDGVQNVKIYGYGAMLERASSLNSILAVDNSDGVAFYGLTIGYAQQSCGQVYVLDKIGSNKLLVVTGAGMMNEFGNTNTAFYNVTGMGAQRKGTFYAYCDTSFLTVTKRNDGLMEMTVEASIYEMIAEGDILTCRAVNGGTTAPSTSSKNILYKDMTVYGSAAGFAFVENDNRSATTYYRVADTTKSGVIIDEATYNWYKALEKEYGVSTEVYIDKLGRYRGSLPHIGSIDATHTTRCVEGSQAISCLFENMCDDGTNQNATHGRISSIVDNGDGTATVTYRGNWSEYSYRSQYVSTGGLCAAFDIGNRVYIYTSKGQLVCDATAETASVKVGTGLNEDMKTIAQGWYANGAISSMPSDAQMTYSIYEVTVDASKVNFDALNGFDLTDDGWEATNKVLIDNMSKSSNGFLFDNTVVRNIRSRGLLIKASDAEIKNCTFENIGMGAIAILYEIYWGESGVTENLKVLRNRFIHTGYFNNIDRYAPIGIEGLGSSSDPDYLLYKNITITDNVIESRTTDYAIFINSAKNITVTGNTFGPKYKHNKDGTTTVDSAYNNGLIHIVGANGVTISDNKYPDGCSIIVIKQNALNITGTDMQSGASQAVDAFAVSVPTVNGNAVTYNGNWTLGYFGSSSAPNSNSNGYKQFTYYNTGSDNGWITAGSSSLWSNKGGIWYTHSYRMAALSGWNVAVCYTVPQSGTVTLRLTNFLAPDDSTGNKDGGFAIFKNGTMIWPTAGGSVSNNSHWYTVTKSTTLAELNAELVELGSFSVSKGDTIYFASKQTSGGWSAFAVYPSVIYNS